MISKKYDCIKCKKVYVGDVATKNVYDKLVELGFECIDGKSDKTNIVHYPFFIIGENYFSLCDDNLSFQLNPHELISPNTIIEIDNDVNKNESDEFHINEKIVFDNEQLGHITDIKYTDGIPTFFVTLENGDKKICLMSCLRKYCPTSHFNPYDKILVKTDNEWRCDVFSHISHLQYGDFITTVSARIYKIKDVLPYEGNESLVGKPTI